ncbi:hypothetical protein GCM10009555_004060 [Acrocarpospora macrocephala]|uniref:Integral membrane protein n=1 Tax=Acrocarpospora macrocephala TaxID=150177 RepID=A0A5M3XBM0_9ACTN|nr:hypothetical protein Amac_104990 [Acrocarpospora macrocephala]
MSNRPVTLTVAAAVLALEGLTALVWGVYVGYEIVIGKAEDVPSALALAGFCVAVGAGFGWVALAVLRALRWSRGPAVVAQIFLIPLAVNLIQAEQYGWGIPLVAAAAIALVTLLAPQSTRALMDE